MKNMLHRSGKFGIEGCDDVAIGCGRFAEEPGESVLNVRIQSNAITQESHQTFQETDTMYRKYRAEEGENVAITSRYTLCHTSRRCSEKVPVVWLI
jgi:type 1 glutamine amidotransferase